MGILLNGSRLSCERNARRRKNRGRESAPVRSACSWALAVSRSDPQCGIPALSDTASRRHVDSPCLPSEGVTLDATAASEPISKMVKTMPWDLGDLIAYLLLGVLADFVGLVAFYGVDPVVSI